MATFKLLIWGCGEQYNKHFNLIKYFEMLNQIEIVGVMSNDKISRIDEYDHLNKSQIKNGEIVYDYCLLAIENPTVLNEASEIGIDRNVIIPIRVLDIPYFDFSKYIQLKETGISIISRNCWGGICYHYLGLEFRSPTINMFFDDKDFNKLLGDFDYYLDQALIYSRIDHDINLGKDYPVGKLDDIELHFNHYSDFDEAFNAWERRKKRIVDNRIYISQTTDKDVAIEFSKLPMDNKLIFVPEELESNNKCMCAIPYKYSETCTIGMYSNRVANGCLSIIDLLSLLCGDPYLRFKKSEA